MQNVTSELLRAARIVIRVDDTIPANEKNVCIEALDHALNLECGVRTCDRLLRRTEVARRLSLSLRGVDRLCAAGFLTKRTLPGRIRAAGIPESQVEALISGGLHLDA